MGFGKVGVDDFVVIEEPAEGDGVDDIADDGDGLWVFD